MIYPKSYVRPDGSLYTQIPKSPSELPDKFLAIWRCLCNLRFDSKPLTKACNHRMARILKCSVSTVKRLLRGMMEIGAIAKEFDESGNRTIWLLIGVRSSRRNVNRANNSGQKNLVPWGVKNDPPPGSTMAPSSSFEEVTSKKQTTPGGGESDGTDPPPGLGEEDAPAVPMTAAEIRAVMMAAAAEVAPVEPARPPTPSPVASAARRPVVESLAERKRRAEPLALAGDRVAIAELAEIEAALARGPAPEPTPPPAPVEPPKSERKPTIWQKLSPWSRKKLE